MPLSIKSEPKGNRQLEVTVEVEQERVDRELRKAARHLAREYRIPGFRRGKAPYPIVVQYVGLPALFNEFIEDLGEEVYKQVLEEADFEPYAPAALDIGSLEPLTYTFMVPLEPEIDLGDYRSLRVEEASLEVSDEEVDEQIEQYREQYAGWSDVDRPSQFGDMLNIDVRSVLIAGESDAEADDDEETIVLDETDWDVTLDEENPMEPPGFDEQLIGMKPDDEKEFVLAWPEDSQSIYAGQSAQFSVKLNSIQAYEKPELDDDFAQLVGPDFHTMADLRQNVRSTLLEEKTSDAENEYLTQAIDALVEQSTMNYPPVVVEDQIDAMIEEFERQLRQYGIDSLESYLEQVGQAVDEYRESLREQAEITARRNLVISELYQLEGIEVSDEDIEARIRMITGAEDDVTEDDVTEDDGGAADTAEAEVAAEAAATEAVSSSDDMSSSTPETDLAQEENGELDTAAGDVGVMDDHESIVDDGTSADSMRAFVDMMRTGSGRSILESQIIQEKAMERLLAIVRGEELPSPPPRPKESEAQTLSTEDTEADGEALSAAAEEGPEDADVSTEEPIASEES